ncbi:Methionyl-tRNA formyltransferase [invertebrate metagenome]|uniref:methionyl-tRNA formyltransferase n=1 Tax=invertebrate metagenome TaxID=1711999 RepID=A0A484H5Q9_9ZZZZ
MTQTPLLRIAFMGTSDFAVPSLMALARRYRVVCTYTRPPKQAGRGLKERRSPVHEAAAAIGLPVRTPQTLQDPITLQEWSALQADVGVVVAYGLVLPGQVLAAPRLGCVNVHASLLPRWRGATPIHRAVMVGDTVSGVTIMQMDAGLDTGPILLTVDTPITNSTTAGSLHDRLAHAGASLLLQALDGLVAGTLVPRPQSAEGVTYARKITESEGRIDWTLPAVTLATLVRGLSPQPGAFCLHEGTRLKVLMAKAAANVMVGAAAPGTVLDDRFTVACGVGALCLTYVQRAGKTAIAAVPFLRGYPLTPGTVLS